jgi:small-conductance mechanosensitive channel
MDCKKQQGGRIMVKNKKDDGSEANQSSFPKKYASKLPDGFQEQADSMSTEELKKKLVQAEQVISSTDKDMENDLRLEDAKKQVKELSADYKETINSYQAVVRYIVYVLNNRGV